MAIRNPPAQETKYQHTISQKRIVIPLVGITDVSINYAPLTHYLVFISLVFMSFCGMHAAALEGGREGGREHIYHVEFPTRRM